MSVPGPDSVGEAASKVAEVASKGLAAAKGPLHAIRGTGENEKMLKNAKTEYWNEFEEIATYTAIESLAESVGDKETAKLAKSIRREEERMAKFLEKQIPSLAKARGHRGDPGGRAPSPARVEHAPLDGQPQHQRCFGERLVPFGPQAGPQAGRRRRRLAEALDPVDRAPVRPAHGGRLAPS